MRIEKFTAEDMGRVIKQVKSKLGGDAVILSNSQEGGQVEVLAAVDYDESLLDQLSIPVLSAQPGVTSSDSQPFEISIVELQEELRELRKTVDEEITELNAGIKSKTPKGVFTDRLASLGLSNKIIDRFASGLPASLGKSPGWKETMRLVTRNLKTVGTEILDEGGVYAVVGSTGVGKTTTVAKLAAQFAYRHGAGEIALITTDTMRIGGQEQLAAFARALGVPLSIATNMSELTRTLAEHRHRKLVLIDTAGMGQRDLQLARHLSHVTEAAPHIRMLLVLSSTVQPGLTEEVIGAFHRVPLYAAVITKIDETLTMGQVLSGILSRSLPVAYLCHGKNIPEDIEPASRSAISKAMLQLYRGSVTTNAITNRRASA